MALEPIAVRPAPHPYSHPLIDWGAAIAGTVVAIAIGFVLLVLGVAIGATAINPWQGASEQAPAWTIGGGLWVIFSNLVAIQVGAFVAVRAARWPDHHDGMLQGMLVWALSFTVAAGVLGFGVTGVLAGADGMSLQESASRAVASGDGCRAGCSSPYGLVGLCDDGAWRSRRGCRRQAGINSSRLA